MPPDVFETPLATAPVAFRAAVRLRLLRPDDRAKLLAGFAELSTPRRNAFKRLGREARRR